MSPYSLRTPAAWTARALGVAALGYAGYVAATWWRYGDPAAPAAGDADPLLDRFMPRYDVADRHHIRVAAPADTTFQAACDADLTESAVTRAIIRAREILLGSDADQTARPRGLLALTTSMGWVVLDRIPGREVVVGAVTQPWEANVVFRSIPPDRFAAFNEPDYVKIVWTLRADAIDPATSIFRTETRAVATDARARAKFRRYWSFLSPGIIAIRWLSLRPLKADAERRCRGDAGRAG
jgi:hypothetical protein